MGASRTNVRLVAVAAVAALALVASACGGSTTANAGASEEDDAATIDGPGVTDDTVKIGFILLDFTKVAKALKLEVADQGDQQAQVEALVAWANENGGIGGRQIEAVTKEFDALLDSADTEEKLCNEFTQDEEVFAVVMWGMFQENLRPCFEQAETVMVENTLYPLPEEDMESMEPYYMAPNFPVYDDVIAGLEGVFDDTGYLEGGTVGILGVDTEANRAIVDEQLLPILEANDAEPVETRWIDLTDDANIRAGYEQAIIAYKAAGVDRLVTVGGSRLLSYFLDYATKQDFYPRLVLTSYDNIDFNVATYPESMVGAVGLSAAPSWDLTEAALPSPFTDLEGECLDMYAAAGITFAGRPEARTAVFNCDSVMFMREAADAGEITADTPLNATVLHDGALELEDDWEAGQNYLTDFRGVVAGAAGYRAFTVDEATGQLVLVGEAREF